MTPAPHMIVRVTAPEGMMSIPDIISGDYDLDKPNVKQLFNQIDLWGALKFLEIGQKVVFECVDRVDNPCMVCGQESDITVDVSGIPLMICDPCMGRAIKRDKNVCKAVYQYIVDAKGRRGANE